jgi:hypothetical protein
MSAIEQQILEKVSRLAPAQQQRVLAFVEQITTHSHNYTARELMRLPVEKRNAILLAQLAQAAEEDFESFEAYSEENINDLP